MASGPTYGGAHPVLVARVTEPGSAQGSTCALSRRLRRNENATPCIGWRIGTLSFETKKRRNLLGTGSTGSRFVKSWSGYGSKEGIVCRSGSLRCGPTLLTIVEVDIRVRTELAVSGVPSVWNTHFAPNLSPVTVKNSARFGSETESSFLANSSLVQEPGFVSTCWAIVSHFTRKTDLSCWSIQCVYR